MNLIYLAYLSILFTLLTGPMLQAQLIEVPLAQDNRAIILGDQTEAAVTNPPLGPPSSTPEAQWDIEFNFSVGDSAQADSMAGVFFYENEFWISNFAAPTLYRFDRNGSFIEQFTIQDTSSGNPISGIRSFTRDDTSVFVTNNTRTLFEIDPDSEIVIKTITSSAPVDIRFASYDSTADGGNGGFWVGNFNTDIYLISRAGAVLSSMPFFIHGLEGMYGVAVDQSSIGGPYLWVFHQTNQIINTAGTITQLNLPVGTRTFASRDVSSEISGNPNDVAGGLYISDEIVPGRRTILGLLQGSPDRIFGYDLDFAPIQFNVALLSGALTNRLGRVPAKFISPQMIEGQLQNQGALTLDSILVDINVAQGGVSTFAEELVFRNVFSNQGVDYMSDPFLTLDLGEYDISIRSSPGRNNVDEVPENDLINLGLTVTDSIISRDFGAVQSGVGVDSLGGIAAIYSFPIASYVQGIEVVLTNAPAGDSIFPLIIDDEGGAPIARGPARVLDGTDSLVYLPLDAPIRIPAGENFGFGIFESGDVTLATTRANYEEDELVFTEASTLDVWLIAATPRVNVFMRPVLASCSRFGLDLTILPDSGSGNGAILATPINNLGAVQYIWDNGATVPAITELSAGDSTCVTVIDDNNCQIRSCARIGLVSNDLDVSQPLLVQPNPANDWVLINLPADRSIQHIVLRDLNGRDVSPVHAIGQGQQVLQVNTQDLIPGVYLIAAYTEDTVVYQRLIIQ